MNNGRQALSVNVDRLGIIASALCFVHCILTPVVLSLSAVWAHYLPSEELFHRALAVLVAAIGCFAFISGYRKHRRLRVLLLLTAGFSFIFFVDYLVDFLPTHTSRVPMPI